MEKTTTNKPSTTMPPCPGPAPWLVFPNGEGVKKLNFFNICDPNKKNYIRSFPEVHGKQCLASMHGWLVMVDLLSDDGDCLLWNSETREIIDLPPLGDYDLRRRIHMRSCTLVSSPTNPDCMVLFAGDSFLLSWRLGDENWTKDEYEIVNNGIKMDDCIDKVISCTDGKIYGLTMQSLIVIINWEPCRKLSLRTLDFGHCQFYSEALNFCSCLVESCGEIVYVVIHFVGLERNKVVNHVQLFKMDFSEEVWVRKECLGDNVLFISPVVGSGCMSLSATKTGLKGNCVYFTIVGDKHSLYVFDLEDEIISVYLPCRNLRTPSFSPFWLLPTNRMVEKQKAEEIATAKVELKMGTMHNTHAVPKVYVEKSENSYWIDLPVDILGLIAIHLPLAIDYMNLRYVSKRWASSVPPFRWRVNLTGSTIEYPWLMSSNRGKSRCKFLDPTCNITYHFDMPELLGARICFSKDGWLLMSSGDYSMFFFNPFTMDIVQLPDLPYKLGFWGISFSSAPTSSDCVTFGICFLAFHKVNIYLVRLGDDAWTNIRGISEDQFIPSNVNPVFSDGAFYCLGQKRYLGIFDIKDGEYYWTVLCTTPSCSSIWKRYLLEDNGEILLVLVGPKGKYVHVFTLDYLNETWRILSTLEGKMLFVSRFTSLALKAVSKGMENKIYFPISFNDENNYLFYSLDTGRWHSCFGDYSREDLYTTRELLHCAWMQPTLSYERIQESGGDLRPFSCSQVRH